MNQRLGQTAKDEIRRAMTGLVGKAAAAEAKRQVTNHGISKQYVYDLTKEVRGEGRPRKRRSDAGVRKYDLVEGSDTFEAAALVVGAKLDPDQALLTMKANGAENLPALATFQRMLRENEIGRKQRREGRRNHRRFEAAAPLDLVQIDSSACKVRWLDYKTRRIIRLEGIDKNHPQLDPQMLRVWQVSAVDDNSRRRYTEYIATHHITSADMVRFFCNLCCEWGGVPKVVYTDNGPEFKALFKQAVRIVASINTIKDNGGFEHMTHAPGNAQATGKVENSQKRIEKMNRFIGLAEQKGVEVTVDSLPEFARAIDRYDNESKIHRETGATPITRWFGQQVVSRSLPQDVIRAALLFQEATRTLTDTMTVRVGKVDYRIPARDDKGNASPFKKGMKLRVIAPDLLDEIFVTLPNGEEFAIVKDIATTDVALTGVRKAAPSHGETLTKSLNEHHKQRNREAKDLKKLTGETFQVPFINHEVAAEKPQSNVIGLGAFKHPEIAVTAEDIATASPVPMDAVQASAATSEIPSDSSELGTRNSELASYTGRDVNFWEALDEFKTRFETLAAAKDLLLTLFPDQQGTVNTLDIETALDRHFDPQQQEVASIRLAG